MMRSAPPFMTHLSLLFALFYLIVLLPLSPNVGAQETSQETSQENTKPPTETPDEIRKRQAEEQRQLEALETKKAGVKGRVAALDKERKRLNKLLIDYANRIQKSEIALTSLETKLERLQKKEARLRASLKSRHAAISDMLGLLQRMGRNPPPILATHRDDALKMVRSAMLMRSMLPELKTKAETLKAEIQKLIDLKSDIAQQSERLRIQNAELEHDQLRVKELLSEKDQRILSHNQELQKFEKRAQAHAQSVANLGELITRLDEDLKRKTELGAYDKQVIEDEATAKKKFGKKALVELTPAQKKNIAFKNPGRIGPAIPFTKVKHTLNLPATGKILRKFGDRMKYGQKSKGISIETRDNAQVTSPSDGWIVWADKFRKYGQLLIINAGENHHILLVGMKRIDVRTSQFVLAGEPIGVMGKESRKSNDKEPTKPVLYVEFKKNGKSIDPAPWWAEDQLISQADKK